MTMETIETKLKVFQRGFGAKLCSQDMLLFTNKYMYYVCTYVHIQILVKSLSVLNPKPTSKNWLSFVRKAYFEGQLSRSLKLLFHPAGSLSFSYCLLSALALSCQYTVSLADCRCRTAWARVPCHRQRNNPANRKRVPRCLDLPPTRNMCQELGRLAAACLSPSSTAECFGSKVTHYEYNCTYY